MKLNSILSPLIYHPLFGISITLLIYQFSALIFKKTRCALLQPVLVAMILLIAILKFCNIEYEVYADSTKIFTSLLGTATVALAIPLYMSMSRIKSLLTPIIITLFLGGIVTTGSIAIFYSFFGKNHKVLLTLIPKSVTSPIAILLSNKIGGIGELTSIFVIITGIIGAVIGPRLLDFLRISEPEARGIGLGITSHAIGVSVAIEESKECGAFAALGMSLMGITSAIFLPFAVAIFS